MTDNETPEARRQRLLDLLVHYGKEHADSPHEVIDSGLTSIREVHARAHRATSDGDHAHPHGLHDARTEES